ncbi:MULTISPECIES: NeuD/PglB/VioB family sugar acetyltransferase [unclassified Sulfurospirillum]|uniref:NeuD/PglB/VioB family sugar acetyltransferase n=1 Tax=unclassified Sulfurospirillum TaxID=2618290 RepID=UPI000500318F|nr:MULTISPECIES: NeuD/PglB/VioB family sugar acetyltransferase [unclassified Sulfurospirillum]KFL34228.1 acetyltransferase [Sulfurospirillum sp. SCADC]
MKKKILLIGGGGHCKSVIDVIELENKYEIAGIIDKKECVGQDVLGYKIIGSDDNLEDLRHHYSYALITIGHIKSAEMRIKFFEMLKVFGYVLPIIISPLAYVSKHAKIGEGCVIMHHALINSNVVIGQNCIINTKSLIEHDAIIEKCCHISTGAIVNGGAHVNMGTFYGSNATCKEYAHVSGFIKAGSVVK